jgi:rhamnulokinase
MPGSFPPHLVAIDLGAESCRVSLLQWQEEQPVIELVHRFANSPMQRGSSLRWDLTRITSELENGLQLCAARVHEPIVSVGVDGWAVDYVRLNGNGTPLAEPFCYRDARTEATEVEAKQRCARERLYRLSGVQPLRINTLYQLMADGRAGDAAPWLNLPEYVLAKLGGRRVAEYTNATHTGLVDVNERRWSREIFETFGLNPGDAPELVGTGTELGVVQGEIGRLDAFRGTRLIAPACHDTASAVVGIPMAGDDWAYISSGTWSLVGTLLDAPVATAEACAAGFTNLGAAGGRICFHKNVNGMWLLKQCLAHLCEAAEMWPMAELVAAAERVDAPETLLDVDDPSLLLPGDMASRINAQLRHRGAETLEEHPSAMPRFASLIFHSLARRYATVLADVERLTGKKLKRISMVGGGSLNQFLNRLTAESTGLELSCGVAESSTMGNFAVQLATLEGARNSGDRIAHWARELTSLRHC